PLRVRRPSHKICRCQVRHSVGIMTISCFKWRDTPMSKCTLAIVAFTIGAICLLGQQGAGSSLQRVDRGDLCVTNGVGSLLPSGRLAIETPSSRAVIRTVTVTSEDQVAEIRFSYLGPTSTNKPLASGELRRH